MSVGRTSLLLTPIAIGSRAVAFVVPVAIARWCGVQGATDAFYWALSVPAFLVVLGGTTLGTVLVPPLAELRARDPARVPAFLGSALAVSCGVAAILGAGFATAAPLLLPIATRFDEETRRLAV